MRSRKNSNRPLGPLGNLSIKSDYKDDGTEKVGDKSVAKITFTSTVTYTAPTAQQTAGASTQVVKGDLKSEGAKGTILFDAAAARARCKRHRKRILEMTQSVSALHVGGAFSATASDTSRRTCSDPNHLFTLSMTMIGGAVVSAMWAMT